MSVGRSTSVVHRAFLLVGVVSMTFGLVGLTPARAEAVATTVTLSGPTSAKVMDTMCYDATVSPVPSAGFVTLTFTPLEGDARTFETGWSAPGQAGVCVTLPVETYEVVARFDDGSLDQIGSSTIELIVSKRMPGAGFWPSTQESSKSLWVSGYVDGVNVIPTGDATIYELVGSDRVLIGTTPLIFTGVYAISDATFKLPPRAPGMYAFEIDYSGSGDLESVTGTGSITVVKDEPDIVPPEMDKLTWSLVTGTAISRSGYPVRLTWAAKDVGTGIARFEASLRIDAGGWSAPRTAPSDPWTTWLPAHTYGVAVRGVDYADNAGAWTYSPQFRIAGVSQSSSAIHYHGAWSNSTSTIWWGGTAKSSSGRGATASYTFTGRSVAWVGLKAATRGKAQVYVNGVLRATVDLFSATTKKQLVVWSANYATSATRTVTIKVLGTSGRPRVDVDGFIVGT